MPKKFKLFTNHKKMQATPVKSRVKDNTVVRTSWTVNVDRDAYQRGELALLKSTTLLGQAVSMQKTYERVRAVQQRDRDVYDMLMGDLEIK